MFNVVWDRWEHFVQPKRGEILYTITHWTDVVVHTEKQRVRCIYLQQPTFGLRNMGGKRNFFIRGLAHTCIEQILHTKHTIRRKPSGKGQDVRYRSCTQGFANERASTLWVLRAVSGPKRHVVAGVKRKQRSVSVHPGQQVLIHTTTSHPHDCEKQGVEA